MKIRDARRPDIRPAQGGKLPVLKFNIEIADGVLLYDALIERMADGRHFLHTPKSSWGAPTASFSPEVRRQIIALALDALQDANDQRAAA